MALLHHVPRSQAVAAALAGGRPGAGVGGLAEQQSVHLGMASCPLAPLLTRPQVGGASCYGYQGHKRFIMGVGGGGGEAEQHSVHLGTALCPLAPLLTRPWVGGAFG